MGTQALYRKYKGTANTGLVTLERASRNIVYRAAFEHFSGVLKYVTENCCEGAECAVELAATTARSEAK